MSRIRTSSLTLVALLVLIAHGGARADEFDVATQRLKQGHISEARDTFIRIIELHPDHLEARNNLAVCLIKDRRFKEAEDHLKKIMAADPNRGGAWLNMGVATQANPTSAVVWSLGAAWRFGAGKGYEAQAAKAHFNVGWLRDEMGDYGGAIEAYTQAINLWPPYPRARIGLAIAHAKLGQFEVAHQALSQAERDALGDAEVARLLQLNRETLYKAAQPPPQAAPAAATSTATPALVVAAEEWNWQLWVAIAECALAAIILLAVARRLFHYDRAGMAWLILLAAVVGIVVIMGNYSSAWALMLFFPIWLIVTWFIGGTAASR